MKLTQTILARFAALTLFAAPVFAQGAEPAKTEGATPSFDDARGTVRRQLDESIQEINRLREEITAERLPLNRRLSEVEAELGRARTESQQVSRSLNAGTLAMTNAKSELTKLQEQERYLSGLLSDYVRKFDSALHIAELKRYADVISAAQLAPENKNLDSQAIFRTQVGLVTASLGRLEEALGGARYEGSAVDGLGVLRQGAFVQVGPVVLFRSADGSTVGTVDERLGSQEPTVFPFFDAEDLADASALCVNGQGRFTLDPTMGNAHKMAQTEETLWEHIIKGGPVMWPILGLAAAALIVVLYKWAYLAMQRTPSKAQLDEVLAAVGQGDINAVREKVANLRGPVGQMLAIGAEHIREPRELIEEAMYESVLTSKQKLLGMLPFVAISASSAPLLGLLGTVTGIINTFTRITVFGSGDVKSLSGGISEALITTEWGLIVAIPALLLHAFLTRKARGIIGQMESAAVAFVNELSRSKLEKPAAHKAPERKPTPAKV